MLVPPFLLLIPPCYIVRSLVVQRQRVRAAGRGGGVSISPSEFKCRIGRKNSMAMHIDLFLRAHRETILTRLPSRWSRACQLKFSQNPRGACYRVLDMSFRFTTAHTAECLPTGTTTAPSDSLLDTALFPSAVIQTPQRRGLCVQLYMTTKKDILDIS
jgi:hypothetical protein